jgi:hypothetical protein
MRRGLLLALAVVVVVAAVLVVRRLDLPVLARIGAGYTAEQTCACLFVSGRSPDSCRMDLDPLARKVVSVRVDPAGRTVSARGIGFARATARYEPGFGCSIQP